MSYYIDTTISGKYVSLLITFAGCQTLQVPLYNLVQKTFRYIPALSPHYHVHHDAPHTVGKTTREFVNEQRPPKDHPKTTEIQSRRPTDNFSKSKLGQLSCSIFSVLLEEPKRTKNFLVKHLDQ